MERILDGKIPFDHTQYSELNLSYQLGFPLIANVFSELIPTMPDYLWPWFLAIFAGILQLVFLYILANKFFENKVAGLFATTLFFAGKLVYENFYNGEFAWLFATAFMFLFFYLYLEKSKLQYLIFPTIFAIHPAVAFNTLILLGTHFVFFKPQIRNLVNLSLSLVLVVPLIVMSYFPIAYNFLFNKSSAIGEVGGVYSTIITVPFWIGTSISIIFLVTSIGYLMINKKLFQDTKQKFLWALLFLTGIIFLIFNTIGFMLTGRIIELIFISVLLISTSYLLSFKKIVENKKITAIVILSILVLSLFFFSTSSLLNHYRSGSKASPESTDFAVEFYNFNPAQEKCLFLTQYRGKIAEYSNKIPYDVNTAHMILLRDFSYYPGPAFDSFKEKSTTWARIYYDKEIGLIQDVDVNYIVVDITEFGVDLNYPIVFSHGNFLVYEKPE
jgi:hypothetical protein